MARLIEELKGISIKEGLSSFQKHNPTYFLHVFVLIVVLTN